MLIKRTIIVPRPVNTGVACEVGQRNETPVVFVPKIPNACVNHSCMRMVLFEIRDAHKTIRTKASAVHIHKLVVRHIVEVFAHALPLLGMVVCLLTVKAHQFV
nr:MAG TPA: hypothetical protein [Caudoviricetes sp.]